MSERDAFVTCVERQVGKRYVWATAGPDTFDCSGLVAFCYQQATGEEITRSSYGQFALGKWVMVSDLELGDLGFWDTENNGTAGHVGVIGSDGVTLVNALNSSRGVIRSSSIYADFGGPFLGIRRLPWRGAGTTDPPKPSKPEKPPKQKRPKRPKKNRRER